MLLPSLKTIDFKIESKAHTGNKQNSCMKRELVKGISIKKIDFIDGYIQQDDKVLH